MADQHQANATKKPTENTVHGKFYFSNTECCQLLHYMSPHLHVPLKEHCFQLHLPRDTKVPVHCFFVFWHNKNSAAKLSHTHTQAVESGGAMRYIKMFCHKKKKKCAYTHTCAPEQRLTEPQLTRVSKPPPPSSAQAITIATTTALNTTVA